jgi:hypothetical protein
MSRVRDIKIKNLIFNKEKKGFFFSKSYVIYTWKFKLDNVNRIITLAHSKMKGKRVITLDNKQICLFRKYTYNFSYEFPIDTHTISINQINEGYILKIDGMNFQKLVNQEKLQKFSILRNEYIKEHPVIANQPPMEMNQFNYTIQNRENLINKEDEKKDENDSGRKNKENEIKGKEDLFEGHLNNFENIQKNNSQDEIVRNKLNINDNIKDNYNDKINNENKDNNYTIN